MNKLRNEKGAALVLTIMMITLFLVFILGLFTQVTNTTKQVTTMEKQIDAQLIADMGVTYFQRLVEINQPLLEREINEDPDDDNLANVVDLFIDELLNVEKQRVDVDENRTYEITYEGFNADEKSIHFKSVGFVTDTEATSYGTIVIHITGLDESGVPE
ncbi:hypothetical protein [Oceanobacillus damuensis]|uniref:hypothetical protein n=1 Tax=Oceanobacillus damuensis TaxID=937928 RepID=UPI000832472F|nr:hypothetical protein [Oceanobacillus damuensis]